MIIDQRIQVLVSRWEQATEKPSAEELCRDCPELLSSVHKFIVRLSSGERLGRVSECVSRPRQPGIPGYEIVQFLGRGGMGSVWLAKQPGTKRNVALKVISAGEFASAKTRARFKREVELASRLKHPNVARIYESSMDGGELYYVQEYIDGIPLDEFVRSRSPARPELLRLVGKVCDAVQHAHQLGVIHRDLKPGNILVDADGEPHLLDFGLAKAALLEPAEGASALTIDEMPGTPAYMSPEQAAGQFERVGVASDLYSLGVVLFQLLFGRFPHDVTHSAVAVMQRIATTEPMTPRQADPTCSWGLHCVLKKALSRDISQRYATAKELAEDLRAVADGLPPRHVEVGSWAVMRSVAVRRWRALAAGALAVVLIGVGINVWLKWQASIVVSTDGLNGQALHVAAYFEQQVGHMAKAESLYRRSLAGIEAAGRGDSVDALNDRSALFVILRNQGRHAEAQPFMDACENLVSRKLYEERPLDAIWLYGYAESLALTGMPDRALQILERAEPLVFELLPEDDPARIRLLKSLRALSYSKRESARRP